MSRSDGPVDAWERSTLLERASRFRFMRALVAYTVLIAGLTVMLGTYALDIRSGVSEWQAGDWLINYGGGFVRRGLFGELLLSLTPSGSMTLWILFTVQVSIFGLVILYLAQKLHASDYSWHAIALVCAPAGVLLGAWSASGGFRKEILVYAVLVLLAWSRSTHAARTIILTIAALLTYTVAVFSWEPAALLLPGALFLMRPQHGESLSLTRFRAIGAGAAVLIAAAGLAVTSRHHGDWSAVEGICRAVTDHGLSPENCDGAINAIGWSTQTAMDLIVFPLYLGYLVLVPLVFLPVWRTGLVTRHRVWTAAIVVSILPLFAMANDYGRWLSIILVALTICTLADSERVAGRHWSGIGATLYIMVWGLPHYLNPEHFLDREDLWAWRGFASTLLKILSL